MLAARKQSPSRTPAMQGRYFFIGNRSSALVEQASAVSSILAALATRFATVSAFAFAKLLSPVGFFAPAQSASRPLLLANPFRHFPNASNPKRLKPRGGRPTARGEILTIAQRFNAGVLAHGHHKVPLGTKGPCGQPPYVPTVPPGTFYQRDVLPSLERLGYCQPARHLPESHWRPTHGMVPRRGANKELNNTHPEMRRRESPLPAEARVPRAHAALSDAMSITKRYFTSLFNMRS